MRVSGVLVDLGILPVQNIPTPEVSLGSLAGSRPHLTVLARNAGLWHRSVGLNFGMAAAPTTSDRPPHRSSTFFSSFFILHLRMAVKDVLIYICVCVCIHRYFIRMMENLCRYTPEPPCPKPQLLVALELRLDTRHLTGEGGGGVPHRPS
jgi:hypothetical protein